MSVHRCCHIGTSGSGVLVKVSMSVESELRRHGIGSSERLYWRESVNECIAPSFDFPTYLDLLVGSPTYIGLLVA